MKNTAGFIHSGQFVEERILRPSMLRILERHERNGAGYPFVDTKFDIVSDRDFSDPGTSFRSRNCIYSWIQGRGLESLAKHAFFFEEKEDHALARRLDLMLAAVVEAMEKLRARNGGHLLFAMTAEGSPLAGCSGPGDGESNFSDLFYSKGLFWAALRLKDSALKQTAEKMFFAVIDSIRNKKFHTDQKSFDVKNPVEFVPGKFPQGPRMIALSGLADMIGFSAEVRDEAARTAEEFIRFIFRNHISLHPGGLFEQYDFIESLDADERVWREKDGGVFCDPGHALEFVGLASQCLTSLWKQQLGGSLLDEASSILPQVFCHVFDYGFNPAAGGICKGFDLIARKTVNTDMPWWSLPETVRAGMLLMKLWNDSPLRNGTAERTELAWDAFRSHYLMRSGFACQTRSAAGEIIPVVPAVPDADPGYHTNLSLIAAAKG